MNNNIFPISIKKATTLSKSTLFVVFTLFILIIAGACPLVTNDYFHILIFCVSLFIFIKKGNKIDNFTTILIASWIIINCFAYYVNYGIDYSILTFGGVTIKILYPYFVVKIIGSKFFEYLLNYLDYLIKISLIFYFLDIIFPFISENYSTYLNFMSHEEQKQAGGWYIFVYMHSGWGYMEKYNILRNSGFMWEPGAYSVLLILALILNFANNKFNWDSKSYVYVIALLTTFSTSGYMALAIIFLSFIIFKNKEKKLIYIFIIPLLFFGIIKLTEIDFIGGKLRDYYDSRDVHYTHESSGVERVNRIGIFVYTLEHTLNWPFGNGSFDSLYLKNKYGYIFNGPNVFADLMHKWGIIGLFFYIIYLIKFFQRKYHDSKLIGTTFAIALGITFFSNPMVIQLLVYSIFYYYIIYYSNKSFRSNNIQLSN